MPDKILGNIKEIISVEKLDDTKILTKADDKLPDGITLKRIVILMTYLIKDGDRFYGQLFLEYASYNE